MATKFKPPPQVTEWPDQPIAPVGEALAQLFESASEKEWRDVRGLFVGYVSYPQTQALIDDQLEEGVSDQGMVFLEAFRELADGFQSCWSEWKLVLGSVAEEAFRVLLAQKYAGQPQGPEYHHAEGCPELYAAEPSPGAKPIASMGSKSMDAICWDKVRDCGEMHEVKATILNFSDSKKAVAMRNFKKTVLTQAQGEVWFGFSGFFDPLEKATDAIRTLLGLQDTDEPLLLDMLVHSNYAQWRKKSYLEAS